jgi:hypothetical protein
MSLYIVSKSRHDGDTLTHVEWATADGSRNAFNGPATTVVVDRVVEAIDRGDVVEMRHLSECGWVSSGKLVRKVQPNGTQTIIEEREIEGQRLIDMPAC